MATSTLIYPAMRQQARVRQETRYDRYTMLQGCLESDVVQ